MTLRWRNEWTDYPASVWMRSPRVALAYLGLPLISITGIGAWAITGGDLPWAVLGVAALVAWLLPTVGIARRLGPHLGTAVSVEVDDAGLAVDVGGEQHLHSWTTYGGFRESPWMIEVDRVDGKPPFFVPARAFKSADERVALVTALRAHLPRDIR